MFGFGESNTSHPGELGFLGRLWENTKHVVGKTLKWGIVGAIVGAVVGIPLMGASLVFTAPASLITGAIGAVTSGISGMTAGFASGGIVGALTGGLGGAVTGLLAGKALALTSPLLISTALVGGVAALGGLVFGLRGAGAAADEVSDEMVANFDRAQMRNERAKMMDMKLKQQRLAMAQQAQEMGIANPNVGLPGQGHGHGVNV